MPTRPRQQPIDEGAVRALGSSRRPMLIGGLALASLLCLGVGIPSIAVWTDSEAASGAFSAGTIDLALSPTTLLSVSDIGPGQSGSATLTVANDGTMALRYAMTTSATDADGKGLRSQLQLSVTAGTCPGSGSALYGPGALASAAVGDPAQGAQAGDRPLAAGASEDLCFAWSLPTSTGNSFQGATTTATFTFAAEQTAANP